MFDCKKFLQVTLLLCTVAGSNTLYAHAVVTESTLKIDTLKAQTATQVSLTFNSNVELGLSRFYLVRKGDVHSDLSATKGAEQGQVAIAMPALEAGEYALRFRVFAADGHLTEDVIHFSVKP